MKITIRLINLARIHMANQNYKDLRKLVKKMNLSDLNGTLFDQNLKLSLEKIDEIIEIRKKQRRIKYIKEKSYQEIKDNRLKPISEKEFNATFDTIERNLNKFNNKYKDKVFRLDYTTGEKDLIAIGTPNFFHILGFDLYDFQKNEKNILKLFPEFKNLMNKKYKEIYSTNSLELYDALHILIEKRNQILEEIKRNNTSIINAFNMRKVKNKNFLFERFDFTEFPTCIINKKPLGFIKGDLYLIKDYINENELNYSFFSYRRYIENSYRGLESVLFNYFHDNDFLNFEKRITTSIGCIDTKDFKKSRKKY